MSNNTILKVIYNMGYKGKMTGHGFRSLAMTSIMQELGYRYEVPDLQLSHAKQAGNMASYDRTDFEKERIVMMQQWADYVDERSNTSTVLEFKVK